MLSKIVKNSVRLALNLSRVGAGMTDVWYDLGVRLNEDLDDAYIKRREFWEKKIEVIKDCYNNL